MPFNQTSSQILTKGTPGSHDNHGAEPCFCPSEKGGVTNIISLVFAGARETVYTFWHEHFKAGTVLEFSRFFNRNIGN